MSNSCFSKILEKIGRREIGRQLVLHWRFPFLWIGTTLASFQEEEGYTPLATHPSKMMQSGSTIEMAHNLIVETDRSSQPCDLLESTFLIWLRTSVPFISQFCRFGT